MQQQFSVQQVIDNPIFLDRAKKRARTILSRKNRFKHFSDQQLDDISLIAELGYFTRKGQIYSLQNHNGSTCSFYLYCVGNDPNIDLFIHSDLLPPKLTQSWNNTKVKNRPLTIARSYWTHSKTSDILSITD